MPRPGYSHVVGGTEPPLKDLLFHNLFEDGAQKYGSQEFIYDKERSLRVSWQSYWEESLALANGLLRLGYTKGSRIGIWMPNNYDWVRMQLACSLAGIVVVNVNPAYRLQELKHALNLVELEGIIVLEQVRTSKYLEMLQQLLPEMERIEPNSDVRIRSTEVPSLRHVFSCETSTRHRGVIQVEELLRSPSKDDRAHIAAVQGALSVHDPINVQFTSGTTGLPKAASLTHHNIINNGILIAQRMRITERDRLCIPVPMYHCFGDVLGFLAAASHGAPVVYPSKVFNPISTLEAVQDEKCTALHGVPTMFIAELDHPDFKKYDLSTLRTGIMAGSPCPVEVMKRVINEMNMRAITICYGMTETSPVSFQTKPDDDIKHRCETVGTIHPHVEAKVVDEKTGEVVPVNTPGELLVKGYNVMKGYWNQPDKTSQSIDSEGFMHTGDVVSINEEGYCIVTGRASDMIIRGGENIYPLEIENLLYKHPDIMDVSVVGVPDRKFIETVCAYVIPHKGRTVTHESIKEFCLDKISHFKVPTHVIPVEEFPLTVSGKVKKFELREMFVEKHSDGKVETSSAYSVTMSS